jgi:hypothetical protein
VLRSLAQATLVVLALSARDLRAQTRDAPRPVHGTGVISGVVVSDDADARPVRKARVTCGSPDVAGDTTITDETGRFEFAGLSAGRYAVSASKPSWVQVSYGAKRPLRPGSAIPLADGETKAVVVRMLRGSVITGLVLDHHNQPAGSARVSALHYGIVQGERRLISAGSARTDDRGIYRVFGLPPGAYIVSGGSGAVSGSFPTPELLLTSDADVRYASAPPRQAPPPPVRGVTFAATYYPGTTVSSQAGLVSVGPGEERTGVDFALQLVPVARVEGTVSLPEGGVPAGTLVDLVSTGDAAATAQPVESYRTTGVAEDGGFTFADVTPGQYTVLARGRRLIPNPDGAMPQVVWASTQITVDGDAVTGLALSLEPGLTISGVVRFEARALKPPADLRSIQVMATPDETRGNVAFAPARVSVTPDGHFSISGAMPGPYRLTASFPGSGRPGGWLLKSIAASGQDALDAPFVVQPNQHVLDATITFTDRLAEVTGVLTNGRGGAAPDYTIVLFPAEPSRWRPRSRRVQGVRPSTDGGFAFRNLPPGDYLIAAIDDVEPGEWFDPAFLQRLAPAAGRVVVGEGALVVQILRIPGGL